MAKRNSLEAKAARRNRKLFRRQLPAKLNLIVWLKDHGYAQTSGDAHALIRAGKVKSESHKVGLVQVTNQRGDKLDIVDPLVPADLRSTLRVEK